MTYDDFADDPARGCAPGKANPADFFRKTPGAVARAKRACEGCPFREQCLQRALNRREEHGVWGGVNMASGPERKKAADGDDPRPTGERVQELWAQGLTDPQIAERLDIDTSSVWGHRQRRGLAAQFDLRAPRKRRVAA